MLKRLSLVVKPWRGHSFIFLRDVGVAFFAMPRKELKWRNHLVRKTACWPLQNETRLELSIVAAGLSVALVAVFIRLTGIG